ncbi:kinase-like domain-containing protein [Boletus edulis]|nr:kinase-like domain-containing protein [Boletus edulis]
MCNERSKERYVLVLGGVRSPVADHSLSCSKGHPPTRPCFLSTTTLSSISRPYLPVSSLCCSLTALHVVHVAMATNQDSLDTALAGEPAQPFDPPGSVRMTQELHFRYSDDRRPRVNQYLRSHRVGKGQHGEVWVCWDLSSNRREVAIKAVKRNNPRAEKMNLLRRRNLPTSPHTPLTDKLGSLEQKIRKEIAIMKKCRHGHIVRLLEVIDDKLNDRIYMVMEYLGGGEIKWRNEHNQPILQVDQCQRICRDVILGLEYLHYQGIIHRDIKPANLLWTADRQMVKITDFGVSHFSYAQRLAAAGRGQVALDDPNDPILLDDSDLSKRAGTPPFLAPEVIAEYTSTEPSPIISASATSTTLHSNKSATHINSSSTIKGLPAIPHRQPITKAIDVWALGVTLYCLLFGHIPFRALDSSEYVLYHVICNSDWEPDEYMGSDRKSTGGRRPHKSHSGCIVMSLLDKFLQKDVRKRITLNDAKRYPWFLGDIPNSDEWLSQTSPSKVDMVMVTENETRTAMTTARFTWGWQKRLTNRISSLFRTVRSPRPSRLSARDDDNTTGVHSHSGVVPVGRHKSATARLTGPEITEKAKKRTVRSAIPRDDSTPNIDRRREKSIERWARSAANGSSRDPNTNSTRLAAGRRGSGTPVEIHPQYVANSSRSTGSQTRPSSRGKDGSSTPLPDDARSRHRFSLTSMWRHSSQKTASQASSPLDSSSGASIYQEDPLIPGPSIDIMARRSDEVLRHHGKEGYSRSVHHNHGVLTAARRASSWGEPMNYVEDVTSLNSGEQDGIDDDAMFLGAGGVEPTTLVSNLPLGLNQATEAINHTSTGLRHPQPERLHLGPSVHICCDIPPQDSALNRHHRSATTSPSPLHHVAYESDLNQTSDEEYESLDSDSSFFRDTRSREHEREVFRANASQMYKEDDESDEETSPIEFKRRRPSVSVTAASPPPPTPLLDLENGNIRVAPCNGY